MGAPLQTPAAQLARLAEKYRLLAELRARREELQRSGAEQFDAGESKVRRAAFRKVAREFPGALRELDATPAEVLRERHQAVAEAQAALEAGTRTDVPLWMELAHAFHLELREALAIKRWLAHRLPRGGAIDANLHADFRAWYARSPNRLRTSRDFDAARLARYLSPPDGRIQIVVYEVLEVRFERPRAEIERLIFGSAR
ncbi:MAG: hypothetical protein JST54_05285 [Deltaproteobacteria bacterium]|nr:hypothetical protein [Deltaproteobacteria bacterium]